MPKGFDMNDDLDVMDSNPGDHLPLLLPISAKSEGALRRLCVAYMNLLASKSIANSYERTVNLCLGASIHRAHHHGVRLAAVGYNISELRASLSAQLQDDKQWRLRVAPLNRNTAVEPEVAFVFAGNDGAVVDNAASYVGVGRQWYDHNPTFRAKMEECDRMFAPLLGNTSIIQQMVLASSTIHPPANLLPPTLFALQYALAGVFATFKIKPSIVMGHSMVGEALAAVVAGCMKLHDAARLVCASSYRQFFDDSDPARSPRADSQSRGVHSVHELVSSLHMNAPRTIKVISLTSGEARDSAPGVAHWVEMVEEQQRNNHKDPVCLEVLRANNADDRPRVIIQLGPDTRVSTAMSASLLAGAPVRYTSAMPLSEDGNFYTICLMEAIGVAYEAGIDVSFKALVTGHAASTVPVTTDLPLYPFDPTVCLPLSRLIGTALTKIVDTAADGPHTTHQCDDRRRNGMMMTYLLEESWLPWIKPQQLSSDMMRVPPPAHTVFICSDPTDAAALSKVKALTKRSHTIVTPTSLDGVSDAMYKKDKNMVSLDFLSADSETIKAVLRGPDDAKSVAIVYIADVAGPPPESSYLHRMADEAFGMAARLLGVLRSTADVTMGKKLKLWVVTTKAKVVLQGDQINCFTAVLWAMTKSSLQECHPSLWASVIDLPGRLGSSRSHLISDTELRMAATSFISLMDQQMVAYGHQPRPQQLAMRDGKWFVMKLCEGRLQSKLDERAVSAVEAHPNVFPLPGIDLDLHQTRMMEGGWHLVTGGLTFLGQHAAGE